MRKPWVRDVRYLEYMSIPEPNTGCWLWLGAVEAGGYGIFRVASGVRKIVKAHRMMVEWTRGPIPTGMMVLHSCDNRACVNPSHLRVGTHAENMRDMADRGRAKRAARRRMFSDAERAEIIRLAAEGVSWWCMAKRFRAGYVTLRRAAGVIS